MHCNTSPSAAVCTQQFTTTSGMLPIPMLHSFNSQCSTQCTKKTHQLLELNFLHKKLCYKNTSWPQHYWACYVLHDLLELISHISCRVSSTGGESFPPTFQLPPPKRSSLPPFPLPTFAEYKPHPLHLVTSTVCCKDVLPTDKRKNSVELRQAGFKVHSLCCTEGQNYKWMHHG